MEVEPKKLFGNRIRELRKAKGISQEALAHLAGIDRGYMGHIERGNRNVTIEKIYQLAHALKVSPRDFF
ncbi:helix-turn-helix domain-containing protein [Endozoicomonas lisbonensis]|uniref:Transcriptional regulator with XRE-family HTH domain n=1 Tax=Endozoicomonas lisbonensis TaxID=3120522 RepID=A0ABV2SL93_9GAMM